MQFPITLHTWQTEPNSVLDAVFANDGPIASLMPGYKRNPTQVKYAKAIAAAVLRGAEPGAAGRITAIGAGTGVGKSIAILIVSGINAALRGKRSLVTTYTRQLNRQLNGKDGRLSEKVISLVTGDEARIALRRPRTAFADPFACRRQANLIAEDIQKDPYGVAARTAIVTALRELADWSEVECLAALNIETGDEAASLEYVTGFRGLIETFFEVHPLHRKTIEAVPYDLYTLDGSGGGIEQAPYRIYREFAGSADVLIATHAALIRDQSFFGIILDHDDTGYASVIADEAHLLEKAGVLALGTKRAVSSFAQDAALIHTVAKGASNNETSTTLMKFATAQETTYAALTVEFESLATKEASVSGDERWLDLLRQLHSNAVKVMHLIKSMRSVAARDLLDRINQRHADIVFFLDVIDATNSAIAEHAGRERYYKASISFSPRNSEPSVVIKPRNGARILSRLWSHDAHRRADALILTSATLGRPRADGTCDTKALFDKIGAGRAHAHRVNTDLEAHFEIANLGTLEQIILAHPSVPAPTAQDEFGQDFDPAWLEFAAGAIAIAASDRFKNVSNRIAVLCTSFDEAERLAAAMPADLTIRWRSRDDNLDTGFDWLAGQKDAILFTVGAHDGVDRPGLFDHVIMPRLPFRRPDDQSNSQYNFRDSVDEMMMTLQQGIGRAFRSPSDRAKIWILDPRIGVPVGQSSTRPHPKSQPHYLDAFPERFRLGLADAVLLTLPDVGGPAISPESITEPPAPEFQL